MSVRTTAGAVALALCTALAASVAQSQDAASEGILVTRDADTMIASELGAIEVVTPDGETLGDVSDTILSHDGRLVALLIGVGGVLGLAEKEVAVRWEHLSVRPKADGDGFEIVCTLAREKVELAPAFRPPEE